MTDVAAGAGSIPLVRLLDAVLAATAVVGVVLAAYRRRTGRGMRVREVASFLGAGFVLHVRHVAERWER